jgi:hypothetical protein
MTWTLEMTGRLPFSMNQRERTSHWVRRRELVEITNELGWLANAERIPAATGKRWVRITLHKSLRSRVTDDPANRDSRAKSCLDALVKLGRCDQAHAAYTAAASAPSRLTVDDISAALRACSPR